MYKLTSDAGVKLPCIVAIDPRTGAKVVCWSGYIEPAEMIQRLVAFVDSHSLTAHKKAVQSVRSRTTSNADVAARNASEEMQN